MKKQESKRLIKEFSENFFLTSEEVENALDKNISGIRIIKNRWLYLKAHESINDLHHIVTFTRQSSHNLAICDEMDTIISKLQSGQYDMLYVKIVGILRKYLYGVQKFVAESSLR